MNEVMADYGYAIILDACNDIYDDLRQYLFLNAVGGTGAVLKSSNPFNPS